MRKRQIIGVPLRFPSSKIYADEYWGKYKKMIGERFDL